jgi:hypothetical protein
MRVVEQHRRRGTVRVLELMYTSFELRDGILEHLRTCSALTIGVLAVIWAIGSATRAAHWVNTITFLKRERASVRNGCNGIPKER